MPTVTEMAQSVAPKGFELLEAADPSAPANQLALTLMSLGYMSEGEVTDPSEIANVAYRFAYHITLAALDLARVKVKRAKAEPTEAEFRAEEKYLEAQLKRLARLAGIPESGPLTGRTPFCVDSIPYCPSSGD